MCTFLSGEMLVVHLFPKRNPSNMAATRHALENFFMSQKQDERLFHFRQEITDDSCSSEETFPLKIYFRVKRALKDCFSSQSTLLSSLGFQFVLVLDNGIMIDTKWRFVTEFSLIEFFLPQIRSYKNHVFVFYTEHYSTSPFDQLNRQTFSLVNIGNENPTFFDYKASSFLVMASNQLYFLFFLVVRVMYMLYVIK